MARYLYGFILLTGLGLVGVASSCVLAQHARSVVVLDRHVTRLPLREGLSMLRDSTGSITIRELIREPARYAFLPVQSPVPMIGRDPIWYKLTVYNRDTIPLTRWIEFDYAYMDEVSGYLQTQYGVHSIASSFGFQTPMADRPIEHRNSLLPITVAARQYGTIYLRVQRDLGMQRVNVTVWSPDAFNKHDLFEQFVWGVFAGWLLLTVLSALFLYAINRERVYLYYAIYTLAHLATLLTNEGLLGELYMGLGNVFSGRLRNVFIIMAMSSNLLFINSFLNAKQHVPSWLLNVRWFAISGALAITLLLFVWNRIMFFLSPTSINYLLDGTLFIGRTLYLLMAILSVLFIVYSLRSNKRPLATYLYSFAFLPLLLVTVFLLFGTDSFLYRFAFVQNEVYAGAVLFEITVLLFGLVYRFKTYRDERERLLHEQTLVMQRTQRTERHRLARDLHDGVGVELAVLRMRLSSWNDRHPNDSFLTAAVSDLDRISREVREVAHALTPTDLRQGLKASLQQLTERLQAVNPQLEINFTSDVSRLLPPVIEQSLYAIAKELLNNVLKHANASVIDIELFTQADQLILRVGDNGQGYDTQAPNPSGGIGLRNLRRTVEELGGRFTVLRKPTGGMVNQIWISI